MYFSIVIQGRYLCLNSLRVWFYNYLILSTHTHKLTLNEFTKIIEVVTKNFMKSISLLIKTIDHFYHENDNFSRESWLLRMQKLWWVIKFTTFLFYCSRQNFVSTSNSLFRYKIYLVYIESNQHDVTLSKWVNNIFYDDFWNHLWITKQLVAD